MKNHSTVQNLLAAYALDELNGPDAGQVESHLAACTRCREELKQMQSVLNIADSMKTQTVSEQMHASVTDNITARFIAANTGARKQINWSRIMKSRAAQGAIAAMLILGILLTWMALADNKDPQQIVQPDPKQIVVPDNDTATAKNDPLQKQKIETELKLAENLFAAGNVKGLTSLFETGSTETKLAVANYLADLRTQEAIKTLKILDISQEPKTIQQAVKESIEKIEAVHSIDPEANTRSEISNENTPEQSMEQLAETSEETPVTDVIAKADEEGVVRVMLKVVEKETGKPIPDADIRTYDRGSKNFKTDADGICIVKAGLNGGTSINLFAAKDGYVGQSFTCGEGRLIDYFPKEVLFELDKGTVVGGIVKDPEGNPLEGATATFNRTDGLNDDKPGVDIRFTQKTDRHGRWQCTMAPETLEGCSVGASHPDYAHSAVSATKEDVSEQLRMQTFVLTLDKGYSIAGTVMDETGNPVKGARAQLGDYYFDRDRQHRTHTDENGQFDFTYLRITNTDLTYDDIEGQGRVPVKYPAEYLTVTADGFAPQMIQVFFKEKHARVEFVMTPGEPIFGRVVDYEGNPVAEATVRADDWRCQYPDDLRTIDWNTKTDIEGRFVWQHAPAEEVELVISKDGFLTLEKNTVKPSDTEYEFILNPKIHVLGQVVDAATKEPIHGYTYRLHEGGYIKSPKLVNDNEGRFETYFSDQSNNFTISFEAEGYQPTNSRSISLIEQDVELLIEMQPDAGLDGVVVDANGVPLEGVRVVVPNNWLTVDNSKFQANWLRSSPNILTDEKGQFHLDPVAGSAFSILVLEESGYIWTSSDEFPEDGIFVLQPYGRIEGTFFKGTQPVVNERIRIDYPSYRQINKGNGVWEFGVAFNYNTQTDEQGKFVFDKLIRGTARLLIDPYREIEVRDGQTVELHIGGDGLIVQGHILTPDGQPLNEDFGKCLLGIHKTYDSLPIPEDEWPLPDNADTMTYSELMDWFMNFGDSDQGRQWLQEMEQQYGDLNGDHSFGVDANGRFEVPNVTPGTYLLTATVRPWQDPDQFPRQAEYNRILAQASAVFVVPEFDTLEEMDIPVDLGTLQCRPAPLAAGQKAPDFEINKLKSQGTIRLTDYRGRTVLVNFTNPILEDTQPEKAAMLEQICKQASEKAAIINVAMETLPWEYMRAKMIPECTLPGLYGVMTANFSKIDADYIDRYTNSIPLSVLIDPAGTVLWIGEPNESLLNMLAD